MSNLPSYDELPVIDVNGQQKRCAWGVFDKGGKKDVLGCLHKATPSTVTLAASEVQDGVTISLNWPLRGTKEPGFGRKSLKHRVLSFLDSPLQIHGFDDEIELNTQCSSQWDSLCHFFDQDLKRGYNNSNPTVEDLVQDYGHEDTDATLPTINHWHRRGGLATRGVLIDYKAHADKHGIEYSPFSSHAIAISAIDRVAREQGVEFRPGDALLVRTGYTEALEAAAGDEALQRRLANCPDSVGVEGTVGAVRWLWDRHFSVVAADNLGFEVMRPTKDGAPSSGTTADYCLHPHLLSLLGLHIGELWDLKALSEYCNRVGRFTFMLTSMPLNYAGACGSPPNAMALF